MLASRMGRPVSDIGQKFAFSSGDYLLRRFDALTSATYQPSSSSVIDPLAGLPAS